MFFSGRLHAGVTEKPLGPGLDASAAQTDNSGLEGSRLDSHGGGSNRIDSGKKPARQAALSSSDLICLNVGCLPGTTFSEEHLSFLEIHSQTTPKMCPLTVSRTGQADKIITFFV